MPAGSSATAGASTAPRSSTTTTRRSGWPRRPGRRSRARSRSPGRSSPRSSRPGSSGRPRSTTKTTTRRIRSGTASTATTAGATKGSRRSGAPLRHTSRRACGSVAQPGAAARALEDRVERRVVGGGVASAQRAERLGVILLRLLRERLAAEADGELLLSAGQRAGVGGTPRQEDPRDLVAQQRQQRGLERVPALPAPLRTRVEHALDPCQRARRAAADERARGRVGGAVVELGEEPEVAEGRAFPEEVRPVLEVALEDGQLAVERALDLLGGGGRRTDEREARDHARLDHRADARQQIGV